MPSFLPIPVEIQRRHGGECESTRAMNLANRPREIVDRGGGSSMIAATIVHNFHGERGGRSVDRDLIFPLTNRILERERFEGLENSRGISLLPSSLPGYVSYVLDSVGTREEARKGREEWLYRSRCGNSGFTPRVRR